ncbi:hypothetical protein ACA910_004127 [Epithemia clementina (nom. ined.)]
MDAKSVARSAGTGGSSSQQQQAVVVIPGQFDDALEEEAQQPNSDGVDDFLAFSETAFEDASEGEEEQTPTIAQESQVSDLLTTARTSDEKTLGKEAGTELSPALETPGERNDVVSPTLRLNSPEKLNSKFGLGGKAQDQTELFSVFTPGQARKYPHKNPSGETGPKGLQRKETKSHARLERRGNRPEGSSRHATVIDLTFTEDNDGSAMAELFVEGSNCDKTTNAKDNSIQNALRTMRIKYLPSDVQPMLRDSAKRSRSSSIYKGVHRTGLQFSSAINYLRVCYQLGNYESERDAAVMYAWAHRIIHGPQQQQPEAPTSTAARATGNGEQSISPSIEPLLSQQQSQQENNLPTLLPRPTVYSCTTSASLDKTLSSVSSKCKKRSITEQPKTSSMKPKKSRQEKESLAILQWAADSVMKEHLTKTVVAKSRRRSMETPCERSSGSDEDHIGHLSSIFPKESIQRLSNAPEIDSHQENEKIVIRNSQVLQAQRALRAASVGQFKQLAEKLSGLQHPSKLLLPGHHKSIGSPLPFHPPVEKDTSIAISVDHDLKDTDIVFGRGNFCYSKPGNTWFLKLASSYRAIYSHLRKFEKNQLARNIVNYIRLQGGRFLESAGPLSHKISAGTFLFESGDDRAIRKTSQALRENLSSKQGQNACVKPNSLSDGSSTSGSSSCRVTSGTTKKRSRELEASPVPSDNSTASDDRVLSC